MMRTHLNVCQCFSLYALYVGSSLCLDTPQCVPMLLTVCIVCWFFLVFRYTSARSNATHCLLDPQYFCHILHSRCSRTLLDRRLHRILHHLATLPLLPFPCQQSRTQAIRSRQNSYLFPAFLLLRVVNQRHCSKRIRVAITYCQHCATLV